MTLLTASIYAPPRMSVRVGVGAVVVNEAGYVLLIRRGPEARNEQGRWATPGGEVEPGETLEQAIGREVWEECGIKLAVVCQLGAFDHLLPGGEQWVSVAFLARQVMGKPAVLEPEKCSECGWFALDRLPEPLSPLARTHLRAYQCLESRCRDTAIIVETVHLLVDLERLRQLPGMQDVTVDGKRLELPVTCDDPILPLAVSIVAEVAGVRHLTAR